MLAVPMPDLFWARTPTLLLLLLFVEMMLFKELPLLFVELLLLSVEMVVFVEALLLLVEIVVFVEIMLFVEIMPILIVITAVVVNAVTLFDAVFHRQPSGHSLLRCPGPFSTPAGA